MHSNNRKQKNKKQKMGVKNKKGCQIEKGKKKLSSSKTGVKQKKENDLIPGKKKTDNSQMPRLSSFFV